MAQKQKLAEMVMQKMKEKKQAQERNRPHPQVLKLGITFSCEQNQSLKQQISQLSKTLKQERKTLQMLKQHVQELDNTGKKMYPVFIIKPQFIASQNVSIGFKEFYRKAANTFLKADIIKNQKYQVSLENENEINQKNQKILVIENEHRLFYEQNIKTMQKKRTIVLKEDLTRRSHINGQQKAKEQMKRLREQNQRLLRQYQIKKQNLENRISYSQDLRVKICQQKQAIQEKYNPVSYRQYLKKIFDVRIKNEHMEKNLIEVISCLNKTKKISDQYKKSLFEKCSLNFIGKTIDTPSRIRGSLQKRLQNQEHSRCHGNPKNLTDLIEKKTEVFRSERQNYLRTQISMQHQGGQRRKQLKKRNSSLTSSRHYSSLKTLKSTFKSTAKSDRTLSTALGTTSTKKTLNF